MKQPIIEPHLDKTNVNLNVFVKRTDDEIAELASYIKIKHGISPGDVLVNTAHLAWFDSLFVADEYDKYTLPPTRHDGDSKHYEMRHSKRIPMLFLGLQKMESNFKGYVSTQQQYCHLFLTFLYKNEKICYKPTVKASAVDSWLIRRLEKAYVSHDAEAVNRFDSMVKAHRLINMPYNSLKSVLGYTEHIEVDKFIIDTVIYNSFKKLT